MRLAALSFVVMSLVLATQAQPGLSQEWGTVKGRVVWGGKEVPPRVRLEVNRDQSHCLCKGELFSEELVVSESKEVANVFAWLIDAENPKRKLPIHPSLKDSAAKEVILDQPQCQFAPHALALREGDVLKVQNSSPIAHNVNWMGGFDNPGDNRIVPPNGQVAISNLKSSTRPIKVACNIHPWMGAWIRVFDHPYYSLTDAKGQFEIRHAPAGRYRLVLWHEKMGWIGGGKEGQAIEIPSQGKVEVSATMAPPR